MIRMPTCEKRTRYKENSSDVKIGWLIDTSARNVSSTPGVRFPTIPTFSHLCCVEKPRSGYHKYESLHHGQSFFACAKTSPISELFFPVIERNFA